VRKDGSEGRRPCCRIFEGTAAAGRRQQTDCRSIDMQWETPQAIDFRFGMEITMYIAKR
jgi:coenzyme PQQ precursor peptide PqqA